MKKEEGLRPGRRDFLRTGASVGVAAGLASIGLPAHALPAAVSSWPDKPIRIVVPYAAGQGADLLARMIAEELGQSITQPIVIENRAGAGGNIGTANAARSAADGYTFLLGTNATNAANEFLYSNLGFNPSADFMGVAMLGLLPMVLCTSATDLPANGIEKLIERARAKPDTLNVGLPSTTAQVVCAEFVKSAQAPLFAVKYKSSGQALTDTIGGQIPLVIDTVTAARPHILSNKLRALGISSLHASEMLPGVKSIAEQGVRGFDVVAWDALFAPRGTPSAVVAKLSDLIQRAQQHPAARSRMMDIGVEPLVMGPSQLDAFVQDERIKWGGIIKAAGIRIE